MTSPFSLTAAEHARIARVDELVVRGREGVPALLAMLSDESWTVRRAVVAALGALGDDAVEPLCRSLEVERTSEQAISAAVDALVSSIGPSVERRVAQLATSDLPAAVEDATRILGRRRAVGAVPLLARLLASANDNVALGAIEALGAIGGTASIEGLVETVRSRNFFRAFPAMQVAARTGDPRVIAAFAELLDDASFRVEAAHALGRTGSVLAVAPLVELLRDPSDASARLCALALSELVARAEWSGSVDQVAAAVRTRLAVCSFRFAAALAGAASEERAAIVRVLGIVGNERAYATLAPLLDDPALAALAVAAAQRIARSDDAALDAALVSRVAALRLAVLPVVHTARVAPAVRALLADDSAEVRAGACAALARIGDTVAVRSLFAALADANPRVAHAATGAIQSLGSHETPALAIAALRSGTQTARRHALRIIAYLGCVEAYTAVHAALADPDPRVAELAVAAIATLADPRVDEVLVETSRARSEGLRAAAMRAAGQRGGERMLAILERGLDDDAAWVRYYACQGLGRLGQAGTSSKLVARLADAMPHVRVAAIEALARLASPVAWQALASAARSSDPDAQRAALIGIGQVANSAALAILLDAAQSTTVATRLVALAELARATDPRALESLARAARDVLPEVRDSAVSLLGEYTSREAAEVLIELALENPPEHPAHAALSLPSPTHVEAVAARLANAGEGEAPSLTAALARMHDPAATTALFRALVAASPPGRRAAASTLVAIAADGAVAAVRRAAVEDPDPEVRRVCAAAIAT